MSDTRKYTVLVLEDEPLLLRAITLKLKKLDIDSLSCTTGKQALGYLEDLTGTDDLPDAIWLDYYLTDMNGLEFIQELKIHEGWQNIPVVVVSNSASDEKAKNMLALGVKKYILKADYRLEEIVDILKTVVKDNI
jgi:CheY-like chemotaxis protein